MAKKAGAAFAAFKASSRRRADVYAKVKAYSETAEAKGLATYEAHFVSALLADFERGGLSLNEERRNELQRLLDADAACCAAYSANLTNDKTKLYFKAGELQGLSDEFIKERTVTEEDLPAENPEAAAVGDVVLTLKYPDILPVMSQCEVEATRRRLSTTREQAYGNNLELVAEGIGLRKEIAILLGYPSWAHFVTETRMSGNPETVVDFMSKIQSMAGEGLSGDIEKLAAAKAEHLASRGEMGEGGAVIEAWDTSFYHNYILKKEHGVDEEAIRAYFPLDHILAVTLEIYQELLGLHFTEIPKGAFESWHDEVRLYIVHDADGDAKQVGHFYLDLHPREGKYGHAAIFHLLKRKGGQTAVDCMLCNLPGLSKDGTPALLRHGDVVTFFHEFGHIMHGLCAEGQGNSTRLAKCPRDFVEAPSQMLENWCWEPSVLARLSKHHVSGESLPAETITSMVASKNVHESIGMMRQIYLATLDLKIHGKETYASAAELQGLVDELRPAVTGIRNPEGANMLRNFGHLMNQYSAAYYGYMWAEVISADMFATKFEGNCMSKEAGMAYRKQVLAPGGTGKIMDHLKGFLGGRAPSQEPFLKSRGILKP